MAKIMLVEDDKSLMEIYSIRLRAEGYEVVTANDGEEALAIAVKERPILILADVMMPKISGFDMLDILRQTPETKDIKVIMMTALSSDDQRQRGEALGADKYLVKSQVGIEDVVKAIHEVLGDKAPAANPMAEGEIPAASAPAPEVATTPDAAEPAVPTAAPEVPAAVPAEPAPVPKEPEVPAPTVPPAVPVQDAAVAEPNAAQ